MTKQKYKENQAMKPDTTSDIIDGNVTAGYLVENTTESSRTDVDANANAAAAAKDSLHSMCAHLLHWSPTSNAMHINIVTRGSTELFDVVIASDCLFFREFHADLIETLHLVLRPGGVGIFLQPGRDGTMLQFIDRCAQSGYFATELHEEYNPQVNMLAEGFPNLLHYVVDRYC